MVLITEELNISNIPESNKLHGVQDSLIASLTINVIGISSDLLVILIIFFNHRLHKTFYTSVLSLSVSHCFFFVNEIVNNIFTQMALCSALKHRMFLDVILYSVKMFSTFNVVLLASVRYVIFIYPIKSRVYLRHIDLSWLCLL
jgi:hypothetical protein